MCKVLLGILFAAGIGLPICTASAQEMMREIESFSAQDRQELFQALDQLKASELKVFRERTAIESKLDKYGIEDKGIFTEEMGYPSLIAPNLSKWLSSHPELASKYVNSIGGLPSETQQVLPGQPIDDPGYRDTPCTGVMCGSLAPDDFSEVVPYDLNSYGHVVRLEASEDLGEASPRCTATILSARFALTALHCFGGSGEAIRNRFGFSETFLARWINGTAQGGVEYSLAVIKDGQVDRRFGIESILIPYTSNSLPSHGVGEVPKIDLALIKLAENADDVPLIEKIGSPEIKINSAITFVGFGRTDISLRRWQRYAAFNAVTEMTMVDGVEYLGWQSGDRGLNGGPCLGDSGGPVFLGFEDGNNDDQKTIVAVVSHLLTEVKRTNDCLYSKGRAVRLDGYLDEICSLTQQELPSCNS